jgi:hypothetical protein
VGGHHDRHPGRLEFGDEGPLLVLAGRKPPENLVAVWANREPRRIPRGHPDLSAQSYDRLPRDSAFHDAVFGHVMSKSLVVAVTPSGCRAFI